jgi:hypothetical protein
MDQGEFAQEMERMADTNGLLVNTTKLTRLLRDDVDAGADFINIFQDPFEKKELLLITSVATYSVLSGLFSSRIQWSIDHEDLEGARVSRSLAGGNVWDGLILVPKNGRQRFFVFGLNPQGGQMAMAREIAQHNAEVAAAEIQRVLDGRAQPQAVDPELEALHRGLRMRESGVPLDTESSQGWTRDDFEELRIWMGESYDRREYHAVWACRCALGYGMDRTNATQIQWFWVNALPAMSGLKLKLKDDPVLAMCAELASEALDRSSEVQTEFMEGIEKEFFA